MEGVRAESEAWHGGVGGASAPRVMKTWGIICDGMVDPKVLPSIINTTRY
jgi:hypothetical protein